jgi:hypothetical protein
MPIDSDLDDLPKSQVNVADEVSKLRNDNNNFLIPTQYLSLQLSKNLNYSPVFCIRLINFSHGVICFSTSGESPVVQVPVK